MARAMYKKKNIYNKANKIFKIIKIRNRGVDIGSKMNAWRGKI